MNQIRFNMTEVQHKNYLSATQVLMKIGIEIKPDALIQLLAANRTEKQIVDDYLTTMRTLVHKGRKQLRQSQKQDTL